MRANRRLACPLALLAMLTGWRDPAVAGSWVLRFDPAHLPPAAIALTPDGGLVLAATSLGPPPEVDLAKLDPLGAIEWQTRTGTSGDLALRTLVRAADGGYALGGFSASGTGATRAFVARLDSLGTEVWHRSFVERSAVESIDVTADGGLLVAGSLDLGAAGSGAWVARLDVAGTVQWSRVWGGTADQVMCIRQTADGGSVLIADAGCPGTFWVAKLDSSGTAVWRKAYIMFEGSSLGRAIVELPGGGFAIAGARSGPGPLCGPGNTTGYLVRLDAAGDMVWRQVYSSPGGGDLWSALSTTSDGGFLLAGTTEGQSQAVIAKVDSTGALLWQKKLPAMAEADAALETAAGDFLAAGALSRTGSELFLAHIDRGLVTDPACEVVDANLATIQAPVMPTDAGTPGTDVASLDTPVLTVGEPGALVTSAVCPSGCAIPPTVVTLLLAWRIGTDVGLQWTSDAGANGYNVWVVGDKIDIDRARQVNSPPVIGVSGCAAPSPAPGPACTDRDGTNRSPATIFYQVRSFCAPTSEGP